MRVQRLLVIGLLSVLSACGPMAVGVPGPEEPRPVLQERKAPRVGLVLGGGAARGFAHVGVIRVLEREKVPFDLIVGTSVGSLVGAIYADKKSSLELEWISFLLGEKDLFDYTFTQLTQGLVRGDRLEEFVVKRLAAREIGQLKIPFAAVATDIQSGETVVLRTGSVARAVRASSSIPGIFMPVRHQGRLLVDGGVLNNVPVDVARSLGAEVVIAVDLGGSKKSAQVNNIFDTIAQTLHLMAVQGVEARLKQADVVIQPAVAHIGPFDFTQKKEFLAAGIQAAEQALPRIREKLFGTATASAGR